MKGGGVKSRRGRRDEKFWSRTYSKISPTGHAVLKNEGLALVLEQDALAP